MYREHLWSGLYRQMVNGQELFYKKHVEICFNSVISKNMQVDLFVENNQASRSKRVNKKKNLSQLQHILWVLRITAPTRLFF